MQCKICGITNISDVQMVENFSPDYTGIVHFEPSPRHVSLEKMQTFPLQHSKKMLVCVNPTLVFLETVASFFHGFQLCGNESPEFFLLLKNKFPKHLLWKSFRIKTVENLQEIEQFPMADAILLDAFSENAHGGTGKQLHDDVLKNAKNFLTPSQELWIAGGVNAENVEKIMNISGCHGVDLSSSVEKLPGKKSEEKLEQFFRAFSAKKAYTATKNFS